MNYFLVSVICTSENTQKKAELSIQPLKVSCEGDIFTTADVKRNLNLIFPKKAWKSCQVLCFSRFSNLDEYKNFNTKIL